VLDASVWVSRLVEQDEMHDLVKSWMDEQRADGVQLISPSLLLAEVGGAITRRTGEPTLGVKAASALEDLPGLRLVEMDDELMHAAAQKAAELGLRGADSVYVAVAHELGLPLVSLDVDQTQRAVSQVKILSISD
jgi:predicted nucleic acid-binding protein